MLKIDLFEHRISGKAGDVTLSRLRPGKPGSKSEGAEVEYDFKYYPNVESACAALVGRLASGGADHEVSSLEDYAKRFRGAEDRIRQEIRGEEC